MPVWDIKGVIHIGAHEDEEIWGYYNFWISKVPWVEANPHEGIYLLKSPSGIGQ